MTSFPNVDSILRNEIEMQGEEEEDDDRLRTQTLDCLRGRLLAERAASRDAKLNAHFFHSKLTELENQLKIETKLRKKAESRLNKLKNKLESLNIHFTQGSHQSTSSDHSHSGESCISSIDSKSDISNSAQITADPEIDLLYKTKEISNCEQQQQQQQLTDNSLHGLKRLAVEEKKSEVDDEDEIEEVDNSMALVVVDSYQETEEWSSGSGGVVEVRRETVREVLNSLKQIKETLRCSLDTSHMIRV